MMFLKYLLFLLISSLATASQSLEFKDHGLKLKKVNLETLKKQLKPQTIKIHEPHMDIERTYLGFPTNKVLDLVYGNKWMQTDEILFTCNDGYQPSVPVEDFKNHDSFLVFAMNDASPFFLDNKLQSEKKIELAPFYLIWNNIKNPELKTDSYAWPYQVTTLDLIEFKTKFPKLSPSKDSPISIQQGFLAFRKYCMTCHSIDGEGGKKSIDLNLPKNITDTRDHNFLKKWIDDPRKMNPGTTMPSLYPEIKDRDKVIENIISYLKSFKKK